MKVKTVNFYFYFLHLRGFSLRELKFRVKNHHEKLLKSIKVLKSQRRREAISLIRILFCCDYIKADWRHVATFCFALGSLTENRSDCCSDYLVVVINKVLFKNITLIFGMLAEFKHFQNVSIYKTSLEIKSAVFPWNQSVPKKL